MSAENIKKENNLDKNLNLNLESNTDNNTNGDQQMATTISSFNLKQNQNNKCKVEKKKYNISFNKTLKSQISNELSKKNSKIKINS